MKRVNTRFLTRLGQSEWDDIKIPGPQIHSLMGHHLHSVLACSYSKLNFGLFMFVIARVWSAGNSNITSFNFDGMNIVFN